MQSADTRKSVGASESQPPVVTVVIPLFNGAQFIEQTLRSVLAQTFRQFEVIVVDDGSTDGGREMVRAIRDRRIRLLECSHGGVSRARNEGARRASDESEFLAFLDADDVWYPGLLNKLVEALRARPDAVGTFALADYIDFEGRPLHEGHHAAHMRRREDLVDGRFVPRDPLADVNAEHLLVTNHVYPPSCLLVRRRAYTGTGGFKPRVLAEDWEFVAELAGLGPLIPVDEVLVGYRRHSENASGNRRRNIWGARQAWAILYRASGRTPETVERIRKVWRAHQARAASRKLSEARAHARKGQLLSALTSAVDGVAHMLLYRPPRVWIHIGERIRARESAD